MKALEGYRIVEQLDGGVEGARYRGLTPERDRPVVLHVLRALRLEPERLAAIEQRVQLLHTLSAPGLAPVLEYRFSGQRPFVAVAADETGSLRPWLERGPERSARAKVAVELIRTLRRAHQHGLYHGNLSLAAIGLGEGEQPLLDFTGLETAPTTGLVGASRGSLEDDVATLAHVLVRVLGGEEGKPLWQLGAPAPESAVLASMLAADPFARPTIGEVAQGLIPWLEAGAPISGDGAVLGKIEVTQGLEPTVPQGQANRQKGALWGDPPAAAPQVGDRIGRYRLDALLGRGSMGAVFRATEQGSERSVALKLVNSELVRDEQVLRRFRREAKLLEEVRHPNVIELYEVNEHQGRLYLALEFVDGPSLLEYKKEKERLPEREALAIVAEVARGLSTAHARGVVHRDLKPGNVLLERSTSSTPGALPFRVRLCDFGIAKRTAVGDLADQTDLTQDGSVGTPKYMAPEQCAVGGLVTPATDVYALGVTLFDLLSGEGPFTAESTAAVLYAHVHQVPPRLDQQAGGVSTATADLVEATLSKDPLARPRDALELLARIEQILGAPPSYEHPALPAGAETAEVMHIVSRYELPSPPAELWKQVSNTERINRAIGLPPVRWSFERDAGGGSQVYGEARQVGIPLRWREHPFEWIEGQRLGVVREYQSGPLHWYVSLVELLPDDRGGTILTHRLWLLPRNLLGKAAAWFETKQRLARRMEAVYRRIGAESGRPVASDRLSDPFEVLPGPRHRERLEDLGRQLDVPVEVKANFLDWLGRAPEQEVARIRPLALAKRLGLPERQVVRMCLEGASLGLLLPLWDVICPTCRIPSSVVESLQAIASHAHCEACNLAFEVDLARSVELIFRVHPEVRSADAQTYCIGGPAHSPHAAIQLRLQPGERFTARLPLELGTYELRVVGEPWRARLRVEASGLDRVEVPFGALPPILPRALGTGLVSLTLVSQLDREQVVRLERTASRDDAFTAADASAHPLFRRLFPEQTFKADALIGLEAITLLVTDLADADRLYQKLGDGPMLSELHLHLGHLSSIIEEEGGAIVKAAGHGVVAAFSRAEEAVAAGLRILSARPPGRDLPVVAAVHRGRAMAATVNERLDYFGRSVNRTHRLLDLAVPGQLVLSEEVAEDPKVERVWRAAGLENEVLTMARGPELEFALRLGPSHHPAVKAG